MILPEYHKGFWVKYLAKADASLNFFERALPEGAGAD